jgi:hypothetical protein
MTDLVLVNRTRTALLPPNAPEKGYQISREEAAKLGLLETADKPTQQRRVQKRRTPTDPERLRERREALLKPSKGK